MIAPDQASSAMVSRPSVWLEPGQGDVARKNLAPVKDALRSVPHECHFLLWEFLPWH
jgi:hypothetical protein